MEKENSCVSSKTLIDLDDDTICCIINFLPFKDQLSLLYSHTRFIAPFQSYARAYLKSVDLWLYDRFGYLNPRHVELFLEIAGDAIESLIIPGCFSETQCTDGFTEVGSKCVNLRKLKISNKFYNYFNQFYYFEDLTRTELNAVFANTLKLRNICIYDLSLQGNIFNAIKHLPELSILRLDECRDVTDGICSQQLFPNMKKLRLYYDEDSYMTYIREFLSVMPNLTVLEISNCISNYLQQKLYEKMLAEINEIPLLCPNLEHVSIYIYHMKNFRWAIQLPKLKCFGFTCMSTEMSEFNELVSSKKDQLISLRVSFHSLSFNRQILNMITQLHCLKTLHLPEARYYCLDDDDLTALAVLQNLVEIKIFGEHKITNRGLLSFVASCRKLKWVNISYTSIDNEFPELLLPFIKNCCRERITFVVWGTAIEDFPNEYGTKEMLKRVQFICNRPDRGAMKTYGYDNFDYNVEEWTDFFETYEGSRNASDLTLSEKREFNISSDDE